MNDGGPAFPMSGDPSTEFDRGMSLRDWFAGKAINSMCELDQRSIPKLDADIIASNCYAIADAMLRAREAK